MKFSVIITGYNCEEYVKECIDSVLAQTYKDYQLFICDDASEDNTEIISHGYKYGVHVNEVNLGALDMRHHIVNYEATGDIVVFLGMDDKLEPNALEVLAEAYKDENIKMTYGSWRTFDRQGMIAKPYPSQVFKDKSFRKHKWLATSLNSFKRELLLQVPIEKLIDPRTDKFFTNCTDLAYSFPCLEMCEEHEVAVIRKCIYVYRHDHGNTTLKRLGREHKTETREILRNMTPCV